MYSMQLAAFGQLTNKKLTKIFDLIKALLVHWDPYKTS